MPNTQQTHIEGTPAECGAAIFEKFCMPALKAAGAYPKSEVRQFYAGLLMAAMGAMAADFGHERASQMVTALAASFAGMGAALKTPPPH
ncbi:MAG: hypothetical protein PHE83_15245 [Opitutaceae bacterium]|nr:hypothetical protein [Opitutaceae bacterium]